MNISGSITVDQKHSFSTALQQGLNVLSMNTQELTSYLMKEMEKNPALELEEEWVENESFYCAHSKKEDGELLNLKIEKGWTLEEHLQEQIDLSLVQDANVKGLKTLIKMLDHNGFLVESDEEVARLLETEPEEIKQLRVYLNHLDPIGVGTRNYQDALLIQYKNIYSDEPIIERIIRDYLEPLSKGQFNKVAKELEIPIDTLKTYYLNIKQLNPKPGNGFGSKESHYVTPDVMIKYIDGTWEIKLNQGTIPPVKMTSYWSKMLTQTTNVETFNYLKDKFQKAKKVIQAVEERKKTLLKMTQYIVHTQSYFFKTGHVEYLMPLRLKDIAEAIGVHESTVSRALSHKYLVCQYGVYPMKYFITGSTAAKKKATSIGDVTKISVMEEIKKIIIKEDALHPFTDSQIEKALKERNMNISRRTVVKYREALGIPNSIQRRMERV